MRYEILLDTSILKTENDPDPKTRVTLYTVRKVFDKLCSKHSFVRRHLSVSADIIHEPLFESAVAKLQGNDFTLTPAEKGFVLSS